MKILLHGATNETNFGDFLFADLFYQHVNKLNPAGKTIYFEFPKVGLSSFFRTYLHGIQKQTIRDVFTADMLIYISGGYFGEEKGSRKEAIYRFLRYLPIGFLFKLRGKPIVIIGVGGGPVTQPFLRKAITSLLNYATTVTVRDEETLNYFQSYGVTNKMTLTSDTAQIITSEMLPALDHAVQSDIARIMEGKKIIFFHVFHRASRNHVLEHKIIQSMNQFLLTHPDYGVIIGSDGYSEDSTPQQWMSEQITCSSKYVYRYQEPWQLCALLQKVDLILTPKLHVGIVGATLSKSVISFPYHQKVKRYYMQIGEGDRCIPLSEITSRDVTHLLHTFHETNIELPASIRISAQQNIDELTKSIQTIKQKQMRTHHEN